MEEPWALISSSKGKVTPHKTDEKTEIKKERGEFILRNGSAAWLSVDVSHMYMPLSLDL